MNRFNLIMDWICYPYYAWKQRQKTKKRLEELRKRDPFIYK